MACSVLQMVTHRLNITSASASEEIYQINLMKEQQTRNDILKKVVVRVKVNKKYGLYRAANGDTQI